MSNSIKVGIIGHHGQLGSAAAEWIHSAPDLELSGGVGPGDNWSSLGDATVVLEVTRAGLGAEHARKLIELGYRPLIGTSGVDAEQLNELDALARSAGLGGAFIPNFSIGQLALEKAIAASNAYFSHVEISEAHRAAKVDAPSGTAVRLSRLFGVQSAEVTSVRINRVTAAHEARLSSPHDSLLLRHESHGLGSFKLGLLASLRYAATATGMAYGLEQVLADA